MRASPLGRQILFSVLLGSAVLLATLPAATSLIVQITGKLRPLASVGPARPE